MIYLFDSKKQLNKIIPRNNIIEAVQTIELNGLYTFYMELPLFHKTNKGQIFNHKKSVDNSTFIGHFDKQDRFQLYKIHDRIVQDDNLIVEGVHLFFDEALAGDIIRDKRPTDDTADVACDVAFNGIGWRVSEYDITTPKSTNFYYESPSECRTKIIETWNVELDYSLTFDGQKIVSKNIHVKNKLGEWTGKRFAYGSNVLQIKQQQTDAEVVTAVIGRGKGEEVGDGYGRRVNISNMNWSNDVVTKPYAKDFIELPSATEQYGYYENGVLKPRLQVVVFEDIENRRELAQATYEYLIQNCVPKVSYETDVVSVGDLNLGDEVGIIYKEVDILRKARVQKLEVNLLNTELTKISLGDYQYFKEDKAKINLQKKIDRVEQDTVDYITQLKLAFDTEYNAQTEYIEQKFNEAVDTAQAEVKSAETRMNNTLDTTRTELESDISTSKQDAITQADTNAKSLTDSVRTDLNNAENRINTSLSDLDSDISDVDTKVVNVSNDLANKVDKSIYDTAIGELKTSDTAIKKDIANAKSDISNAKTDITNAKTDIENAQTDISNVKTDIANAKTDIENAQTDISNAQTLLDEHGTKIDTHDVEITNVKGQLSSKASQTSLDSLKGTVDNHTTSITQNANDIKTKANQSTVDTLNQTVTKQNTLISQNANEIKSKAEKAYVDTINNTVAKNSTLISQTSEKLQLTAESIDNLSVGGRNYIKDSNNFGNYYAYTGYEREITQNYSVDEWDTDNATRLTYVPDSNNGLATTPRIYGINGAEMTFSYWIKNLGDKPINVRYNGFSANDVWINPNEQKRVISTGIVREGSDYDWFQHQIYPETGGDTIDIALWKSKLEKGNIATDWTPASEDLEKEIEKNKAAIELTSKEIALKVDSSVVNDLKGLVDKNSTSIIQNASDIKSKANQSTVDTLNQTVNNQSTLITQNANEIKSKAEKAYVDTINNTVEKNKATIELTSKEIALKVDSSVVKDLKGIVDKNSTSITQNANDIKTKANQSTVDTINNTVSNHSTLISQNATDIKTKANQSTVDTLNQTVTKQNTLISQNASDIKSKASQSTVDDLNNTVSNHSTLISQNASEISSKAEQSLVDTINNTVSGHSTLIKQNATDISSKAEKSDLDNLSGTVSNHTTLINQNADNVKITASKIDNLSVGSRNYIKDSNNFENYTVYKGYDRTITQNYTVEEWGTNNATRLTYVPDSNNGLATTPRVYGINGAEMTFSYWIKNLGDKPINIRYNGFSANDIWIQPNEQKRVSSTGIVREGYDYDWFQHQIYPETGGDTIDIVLWRAKLEKGNIATDWSPAPEDLENKIEANKTELNVQADEIAGLVQKTNGHDTDISNLSQRADNINLSVADLEKWKTTAQASIDVNSQAITNEVWQRDIDSATNTINRSINQVKQTAEGNTTTIQNQISRIDKADDWIATNGQTVIENADMFSRKVWNADIEAIKYGGRNIVEDSNDFSRWEQYGGLKMDIQNDVSVSEWNTDKATTMTTIGSNYGSSSLKLYRKIYGTTGKELVVSLYIRNNTAYTFEVECWGLSDDRGLRVSETIDPNSSKRYVLKGTATTSYDYIQPRIVKPTGDNPSVTLDVTLFGLMVEEANVVSDYAPHINDVVQHSEVKLLSDGFSIGTTKVGGDTFASAIVGNQDGLALIGDNVDVSNNLTVKNTITSEAIKAVRADFASVTTAYLTSNIIDTNMLKSEVVDASKLKVDSALVNKLSANSIFANDIKTKAISAVHADLKSVSSEIMETNILKSDWLQVDTALFDRIASNTAFIDKLTSQSAFIRDLKTISLDTTRANITTVMDDMGKVNGGLTIKRPDGAVTLNNGMMNAEYGVRGMEPRFANVHAEAGGTSLSSWQSGTWYVTMPLATGGTNQYARINAYYFKHVSRYLVIPYVTSTAGVLEGVQLYSCVVRARSFGDTTKNRPFSAQNAHETGLYTHQDSLVIDLGVPDFRIKQFYLEFRANTFSDGGGTALALRPFKLTDFL